MKFLHSLFSNSFLMLVLFAMLFLPIGVMGLSTIQQSGNEVLSQTDIREDISAPQDEQVIETTNSTDQWEQVNYQQDEQAPQNYSEQ
jgi:hypothetical protein